MRETSQAKKRVVPELKLTSRTKSAGRVGVRGLLDPSIAVSTPITCLSDPDGSAVTEVRYPLLPT